jgi:transcription elongation GreA/GreB family factor
MISKTDIHAHCLQLLEQKIVSLNQLIEDARAASNNDTKSSMGDKYETTREMMQIEIDKLERQKAESQQMLLSLKVIDSHKPCTKAEPGAWIHTDKLNFYLAAGLGKVEVGDQTCMVISPVSPIGRAMGGKKSDQTFSANGHEYKILKIA